MAQISAFILWNLLPFNVDPDALWEIFNSSHAAGLGALYGRECI
jgi:hypothetical protein